MLNVISLLLISSMERNLKTLFLLPTIVMFQMLAVLTTSLSIFLKMNINEAAVVVAVTGRTSKIEREIQHLAAICRHYDEIFRLKRIAAKSDVFHMLSGMWKSPAEWCFMWIGGFRSSELLKVRVKGRRLYGGIGVPVKKGRSHF